MSEPQRPARIEMVNSDEHALMLTVHHDGTVKLYATVPHDEAVRMLHTIADLHALEFGINTEPPSE